MTRRFEGRSVIVTGAGRGIGRAHALGLAQAGATASGRRGADGTQHLIALSRGRTDMPAGKPVGGVENAHAYDRSLS